jgi:hypothetical protein
MRSADDGMRLVAKAVMLELELNGCSSSVDVGSAAGPLHMAQLTHQDLGPCEVTRPTSSVPDPLSPRPFGCSKSRPNRDKGQAQSMLDLDFRSVTPPKSRYNDTDDILPVGIAQRRVDT